MKVCLKAYKPFPFYPLVSINFPLLLSHFPAVSRCDGECPLLALDSLLPPLPTTPPATQHKHTYEDVLRPPYRVHNAGKARAPLSTKTLAVDAVHANGLIEYDVHSLYGHAEAMVTRKALLSRGDAEGRRKRPFVLTRSTFSGTGG